jgi:hypothetical protein
MSYEVPAFVTDFTNTPRQSTARDCVTSVDLVAYVAVNPGRRLCEIARVFGLKNKAMGTRLYKMRERGCLESRGGECGDRTLVWFATGKPVEKSPAWRQWEDDEKAALVRLWPAAPRAEVLAAIPTRTWEGCVEQAHRMNLKRKRNIGRDVLKLQQARHPSRAFVQLPPGETVTLVRKAIARMTPLESAWMGRHQ